MMRRPSAHPTVTMDAAKPAEPEEKIVNDVQPSDDGYDTSSTEAEIERPPKRFCRPPTSCLEVWQRALWH